MFTEQNFDSTNCDNTELCLKRLSRKLSEVEMVMTNQEGRANQMKKERDTQKAENEKLKKEITKLNNELLRERMNSAQKEKKIQELEAESAANENLQDLGEIDAGLSQGRRVSVPIYSSWKEIGRKTFQTHPKVIKKLLDKRSNELLQQRQQYRIFESRFKQEAERCNKLDRDLDHMEQLLVDLLCLHRKYHGSSEFKCDSILMLGKRMKNRCSAWLLFGFVTVLIVLFVLLVLEGHFKR